MMEPILDEFEWIVARGRARSSDHPVRGHPDRRLGRGEVSRPAYWSAPAALDGALRGRPACARRCGRPDRRQGRPCSSRSARAARSPRSPPRGRRPSARPGSASRPCRGADEQRSGTRADAGGPGRLWERGVPVDWDRLPRHRAAAPGQPADLSLRTRELLDRRARPGCRQARRRRRATSPTGSTLPTWRRGGAAAPRLRSAAGAPDPGDGRGRRTRRCGGGSAARPRARVPLVGRPSGPRAAAARRVRRRPRRARIVTYGWRPRCARRRPARRSRRLLGRRARRVRPTSTTAAHVSFLGPLRLGHALGRAPTVRPLPVVLVARGSDRMRGDDPLDPARAFGVGRGPGPAPGAPGLPRYPRRRRRPSRRRRPAARRARDAGTRARGRDARRSALPPALRPVADPDDRRPALSCPSAQSSWSPAVSATWGCTLAEALFERDRRPAGAGRPVDVPRSRAVGCERAESPADEQDTRSVLRRLAAMRQIRDDVMVLTADLGDAAQVARRRRRRVSSGSAGSTWSIHGAANVESGGLRSGRRDRAVGDRRPDLAQAARAGSPDRRDARSGARAVGAPLVDLVGARRARPLRVRGRERGPRQHRHRGRSALAQHRLGRLGQRRRGPDGRDARPRSSRRRARRRSSGCSRAAWDPRVVVAVGDLDGPARVLGAAVPTPAKPAAAVERHPGPNLATPFVEPRDRDRARSRRDLGLPARARQGRRPRSLLRPRRPLPARRPGGVGDPRPLPDRDAGAPALQGADDRASWRSWSSRASSPAAWSTWPAAADADRDRRCVAVARPGPDRRRARATLAKASYREFYDDVSRRLAATGMGEASFFLNYGYVSQGDGDEARFEVPDGRAQPQLDPPRPRAGRATRNWRTRRARRRLRPRRHRRHSSPSSSAPRLPASTSHRKRSRSAATTHRATGARFEVGDAENLPFDDASFDVVTNLESSHTYPDMRAFLGQVRRVLRPGGWFLHTDLLAGQRWMEVKAHPRRRSGFTTVSDREITANVLASCDEVAENRTEAFGARERGHRQLPRHPGIAGVRADGVGCVGVPDRPLAAAA